MDTGSRQTDLFYKKCDELAQGGFILADTKLAELLQCIAASDVLYAFFRNLTKDFDYPAALEKYLYGAQGGRLEMPEEPGERLAFSFCLLVDIDAKRIPLGDLLHGHFSAEGGVHASFLAFCEEVVLPFKRGVRRLLSGNTAAAAAAKRAARAALKELVSAERDEVYAARGLSDERKVDALVILNALEAEAERGGGKLVAALLCGYRCFCEAAGRKCARLDEMTDKFAESEEHV